MINEKKYDDMHEEGFLNDIWNGFTDAAKFDILAREIGNENFEKSYDVWLEEFNRKEADIREAVGIEDDNAETRQEYDLNKETQ